MCGFIRKIRHRPGTIFNTTTWGATSPRNCAPPPDLDPVTGGSGGGGGGGDGGVEEPPPSLPFRPRTPARWRIVSLPWP